MYFLNQIKKQFLSHILSNFEDASGQRAYEQAAAVGSSEIQEDFSSDQLASMTSSERLEELKERLEGLKSAESIVGPEAQVLVRFCNKIKDGAIPGLSESDPDFERLAGIALRKVEEYQALSREGHDVQGEIQVELTRLTGEVDREILEEVDPSMSEALRRQGQNQELEEAQQENLESLFRQRDTLTGVIRSSIEGIDLESEDFQKYSREAQIIIRLAFELTDTNREFENTDIQKIHEEIYQLTDLKRDLDITLTNESVPGEETASEIAQNEIERKFLDIKENGTEVQKEIIGDKAFLDMRKGDFMRLWIEGEVDLSELFLTKIAGGESESLLGNTYNIHFGGNPEVGKLLPSIMPISVERISIDGQIAVRTGEREFRSEGGLPVSVRDGSEIVIHENNTEISPEQVETRLDSYRESMASNVNREEFERRVNSQIQQREMNGESTDGNWLETLLKKIVNAMAVAMGEDPIFEEVLEREQELYTGYSSDDAARIGSGGMRRFSPDGQEILRDSEFMSGLSAMCDRLGVQRDDMLIVMQAESGLDPQAVNPRSQASGLIQFMPRTAEGLGTSVAAIQNMTAVEQLVYVERYFENYAGRMNSVADIYRVVFYPASIGKPDDWVLGSQNGTAQAVARQNGPGITQYSRRADGLIDNATFDRYVAAKISQFSTVVSSGSDTPGSVINAGIGQISRGIVSRGMERSESGTTLCSRTARLNLSDLGVSNPYRGSSARASFEMYDSSEISGFPPSETSATVADLYLDASSGNAHYGHRAACFQQDGQWYVLDPYYLMGRSESQRNNPILAEDYINYMQNTLGRTIWGAAYFS